MKLYGVYMVWKEVETFHKKTCNDSSQEYKIIMGERLIMTLGRLVKLQASLFLVRQQPIGAA
eukprot:6477093-Amphidinium_carterae.2